MSVFSPCIFKMINVIVLAKISHAFTHYDFNERLYKHFKPSQVKDKRLKSLSQQPYATSVCRGIQLGPGQLCSTL